MKQHTKTDWKINAKQEVVMRTWNPKTKEVISEKTPQEMGLFREKMFCYVFRRVALDPISLKNLQAYFVQKVLYRVRNEEPYAFFWFYFESGFSLPCIKNIDPRLQNLCGITWQVSNSDKDFTELIDEPKRLTNDETRKALIDRVYEGIPILGLYDENGSEKV
jgi:hypothetical protein